MLDPSSIARPGASVGHNLNPSTHSGDRTIDLPPATDTLDARPEVRGHSEVSGMKRPRRDRSYSSREHTNGERERRLIADAARAQEMFGDDALEAFADHLREHVETGEFDRSCSDCQERASIHREETASADL